MLAMFFCDSDVEAKELCTGILSGVETRIFDCRREQILFFLREPKVYSKTPSANCPHTKTDYSFAGIQGSHFDTGCRRIIETYL
jgi:hypothetical protein